MALHRNVLSPPKGHHTITYQFININTYLIDFQRVDYQHDIALSSGLNNDGNQQRLKVPNADTAQSKAGGLRDRTRKNLNIYTGQYSALLP